MGPPITILPLSLKQEGLDKWRLLADPRYLNVTTNNTYIQYESLASFTPFIPHNMNIDRTDMTAGFQQLPLNPALYPYVVVSWNNTLYYFTTCFLGRRKPPAFFNT